MLARPRTVATRALVAATLAATVAAPLRAQQCDIEENTPAQLTKAFLAVTMAQQAQSAGQNDVAAKQLQGAMKLLTDKPEKINNPLGRQLLLGRALSLWTSQPGTPLTPTRASLGYATDPTATIDLYAALDSTLTAVETAKPACVSETTRLRAGKPWLGLVNAAIERFNAEQPDSAEALASRSLVLYRGAPYAEMILGNIDNKRGRVSSALEHYRRAVAAAEADTVFAEQQRGLLLTMGNVAAGVADTAQGAAKQQWSRDAIAAYEKIAQRFPGSPEARVATDRLSQLKLAQGDTAAVKAAYAAQLASPDKYSYQELLTAGVNATRAGQDADALALFESALKANPYNRDALYNAALVAHDRKDYRKSIGYLDRLVQVDPGNDQGWLLYAHDYAGLNKATKEPKLAKSYSDSLAKYLDRSQNLPYQVRFNEWSNAVTKSTVRGTVRNKGTAAKSYTVTVEFLDAAGQVVGTQTVQLANVAPNEAGTFVAESTSPKAVAFRYKVE